MGKRDVVGTIRTCPWSTHLGGWVCTRKSQSSLKCQCLLRLSGLGALLTAERNGRATTCACVRSRVRVRASLRPPLSPPTPSLARSLATACALAPARPPLSPPQLRGMLKVNCVATASALARQGQGANEPLLPRAFTDRPGYAYRGCADDALASCHPDCLACLPACPRVEVTPPVCLYDEIKSDSNVVNKILSYFYRKMLRA